MDRFKSVKKASVLGVIGNLFLLIIKASVGFATNSQAMIADAMNSAGDIFSSLITYIGNNVASKPNDDDHNLGHGKAEYIYSMILSLVMFMMGFIVFKNALLSIFNNTIYVFSIWLIVVCIITIVVKFALYIYTDKLAKKYNNLLINANSKDHRNDCIITLCNLISVILSLFNIYFFDGIVGIGIAIWMIITAFQIFRESYDVLMDKSISSETKEKVYEIIKNHAQIKKIQHFNSIPIGYKYQISFTIYIDGSLSTFESHEIADKLEKEITGKIDEVYLTIIHVNPLMIKSDKI